MVAPDGAGDVDRGLGAAQRLLDLGLALGQAGVEAGVLDRDPRPDGEGLGGRLVLLAELAAALLRAARDRFPDRWTELAPGPVLLATWVGFDTDGRTDIGW